MGRKGQNKGNKKHDEAEEAVENEEFAEHAPAAKAGNKWEALEDEDADGEVKDNWDDDEDDGKKTQQKKAHEEEEEAKKPKQQQKQQGKKGKKGRKQENVDDLYTSLEDQEQKGEEKSTTEVPEKVEETKPQQQKGKKGKKGRKQENLNDLYTSLEDQEQKVEGKPVEEEAENVEKAKPQQQKGKKGKKGRKQENTDDFYTSLEDQAEAPAPAQQQSKVEKNRANDKAQEEAAAPSGEDTAARAEYESKKKQLGEIKERLANPKSKLNAAAKRRMEALAARLDEEVRVYEEEEERYRKEVEEAERLRKEKEEEEARKREEKARKKQMSKEKKPKRDDKELIAKREKLLAQYGMTLPAAGEQPKRRMPMTQREKKKQLAARQKEQEEKRKAEEEAAARAAAEAAENEGVVDDWEEMEFDDDGDGAAGGDEKEKSAGGEGGAAAGAGAEAKAAEGAGEQPAGAEKGKEAHELRSPICCVLGHVDVGKTKLLDKLRRTDVQDNEAGGITQQIGATYFPTSTVAKLARRLTEKLGSRINFQVPGLLFIDTPGHESFTNLRQRGASLCDIAVLVVDIMHGLEPQTKESISILRKKKCPFIVALNKVDRLFGWKANNNAPFQETLKQQSPDVVAEFEQRVNQTIADFAAEGLNAELYYRNKEVRSTVSLVPTSAHTGEGLSDLLLVLVQITQKLMATQLMYLEERLEASVLEVKVTEGLGTCIDVILVNGILRLNDTIVICGMNGPIVTTIRALLTPQPMKELRVKTPYVRNKEVKAAMGLKVCANGLENAVSGSQLVVVRPGDDLEAVKREVQAELQGLLANLDKEGVGVSVQASTLGSLEALISFLRDNKVPVSSLNIGTVFKKDVIRASIMLEKPATRKYGMILAFDVQVNKEAEDLAKELGVRIFKADIIYHLFEDFKRYMEELDEKAKREAERAGECVWPCVLEILPQFVFMKRNPILVGVRVKRGTVKLGTPICVPSRNFIVLGRIVSIEQNNKSQETAKEGDEVAVKIMPGPNDQEYMYERHFDYKDELVSRITPESLYTLKMQFGPKLTQDEIDLLGWMKHELFKF